MDNLTNKKEKISIKSILIMIFAIIAVLITGTYAWLSWRSNNTAMVLTIGDIDTMRITVKSYQINAPIDPVQDYSEGVEVEVEMTNNGINKGAGRLYYQINRIDSALISSDFKYTILKSIDDGENYAPVAQDGSFKDDPNASDYYITGNFSGARSDSELTILEDSVPAGETYKYKVYLWLDGSNNENLTEGSVFNGELRAEILKKYLYNVLKKAAADGTYAREYTGSHQDSMDSSKSIYPIYHWYGATDADGTAILDMNNVIFAGQCWQMIRTTDTGGVRMIYNGEAVNDQCLNTRGTHVGYASRTSQNLASNYYYGTDYTYDATNKVFSISGTTEQKTWNATTGPNLIGKYTCKQTTENGACSTLYLVESYYDTSNAYVIPLNSSSNYSQFGTLQFNANSNSPAHVGYMYNKVYPVTSKSNSFIISNANWSINSNCYYSDTIDYNETNANQYTLTNPKLISTLSDYSTLVGKYVLGRTGTNHTNVYYVLAVDSGRAYYHLLNGGDLNTSLTIGDSYTESNGSYTLTNPQNISYIDWYSNTSNYSVYKSKYACDGSNTTCTNLMHITNLRNPGQNSFYYFGSNNTYSYAESVSYNNGTYTLSGDIKQIWDIYDSNNQSTLSTHHYTCLENGNSCTTVGYVNYIPDYLYYAKLTGVANIETALNEMLSASNVNITNSTMKTGVDAWYKKYLYNDYDNYIDDTIYCNDRSIRALGSWNPNGGSITGFLQFKEYSVGSDLSCTNTTDKFSISNNNAKLTYKVGLMPSPEMNLLNQTNARKTGQTYWLASPYYFSNSSANVRYVATNGNLSSYYVGDANGVRPAVSLVSGIEYSGGNGSMASPYKVDLSSNDN